MSNFQETVFLKYQRQYRKQSIRKARSASPLLISLVFALMALPVAGDWHEIERAVF